MDIHTFQKNNDENKENDKKQINQINNNINYKKKTINKINSDYFSKIKIYSKEEAKVKKVENEKKKNNKLNIKNLYLRKLSKSYCHTYENDSLRDSRSYSNNNSKLKLTPQSNDSNNEDDKKPQSTKSIFMKKVSLVNKKFNIEKLLSINKENLKNIIN